MSQISLDSFMPDNVGSEDVLFENLPFVGTVEFVDGVLVFLPAFIFIFTGNLFLPPILENYTILIASIIAILGSLTLVIKPNHMTLYSWISNIREFRLRETDISKNLSNEQGKPFDSYEAVPDDDTRKLTKVSRVFPTRDAIELDDGTIISIIEFDGSNLDMAEGEMKLSVVDQYAKAVSSQLEHDIQFYLPKRPISVESTASIYEDRLEEENIQPNSPSSAFMQKYLQDRSNWVRSLSSESYIREQYVIVSVDDSDVIDQSVGASKSSWQKLPAGELLKDIYKGATGGVDIQSKKEIRRKKIRELNNRISEIGGALSVGPGNGYNVVKTEKAVGLIKEFWEGQKIQTDEMKAMSSNMPVSVGKPDINLSDEDNKGDKE
jgi:hypothetical protein